MGQQQLLLIVLGVIIVGIAIVVGINLFNASAEESAKDTVASEATNIAALALQYYKKPVALGGGGGDFSNFVIPERLATTDYTTYTIRTQDQTDFEVEGNHNDYPDWTVVVSVNNLGVYSTVIE